MSVRVSSSSVSWENESFNSLLDHTHKKKDMRMYSTQGWVWHVSTTCYYHCSAATATAITPPPHFICNRRGREGINKKPLTSSGSKKTPVPQFIWGYSLSVTANHLTPRSQTASRGLKPSYGALTWTSQQPWRSFLCKAKGEPSSTLQIPSTMHKYGEIWAPLYEWKLIEMTLQHSPN